MLKYVLLGFLNYGPQTGYELKQVMDQSTAFFWHAKQSQVYTTLKALAEEGLVVSHIEPQDDRPDRRVYVITETGRADLQKWLARPQTEIDPRKETLLLKLFFSAQLGKETILTHLRLQRQLHISQLHLYQNELAPDIQAQFNDPLIGRDARLWDATRRMGEIFEEMTISWLNETIAMIEREF
ncbi:MAG: PadR family transcriptional regulator [Chloroflexi bacterium]|nr:PadR family transcriptional regulator [Chloroflexota bacterium]MBP8055543.1 PadR family transcriptional regulator [Chloroflexota bacterium]